MKGVRKMTNGIRGETCLFRAKETLICKKFARVIKLDDYCNFYVLDKDKMKDIGKTERKDEND